MSLNIHILPFHFPFTPKSTAIYLAFIGVTLKPIMAKSPMSLQLTCFPLLYTIFQLGVYDAIL